MAASSSNFGFLGQHDERFARLGAMAERYFYDDAPSALIKLRQLAEFIAKDIAARHRLLPNNSISFDDALRTLKLKSLLPREVAELFFHLKRVGNAAAHEGVGTASDAFAALKIARTAAIWFHRSYGGAPNFKPGPFVPPTPPVDATAALVAEVEELKAAARASANAEAKALLSYQEAEAGRLKALAEAEAQQQDRLFWENYAAETEAGLRQTEAALKAAQAAAQAMPASQLDALAQLANQQADKVELDEATTRVLIDDQLRSAGWVVDSKKLRHATGARPRPGQPIAISEWPTSSGPVDYALFVDGRCVGVVEAKRGYTDVAGRLGQSKRYARDVQLAPDETLEGGPYLEQFRVPFLFVTNGRPFVKQLATKSGIWFWDARPTGGNPRALPEWFSPRDLKERFEQTARGLPSDAERELGVLGLRSYQAEAMAAVEAAITKGQQNILLAMATGTGKTRLAIALMYEFLHRQRFRRILFLVDRNALGRQALDAMSTTDTSGFLKFDQVFPVADLARKFPEATDRVQVATVQAMIRRVFEDPDELRPTPGTYDLIIVDEAHRGYMLDAELREDDLGFRNLEDYLSAYCRVLDYFDATKIALTATPALHTRETSGHPFSAIATVKR
jgi:type I restriction enzyme R subunit